MKSKPLFILFILFNWTLACAANAAIVFGPHELTIDSWHLHSSFRTFEVENAGEGKLILTKTGTQNAISSGFILYNLKLIPLKSFLRGDQETLTLEVGLREKNRLFILLKGSPGASLTIRIEQQGGPPLVTYFTAAPTTIEQGQSSTLSWSVDQADSITIEPGIGTVDPVGSLVVSPASTTEYTLTANGEGGTTMAQTTITVTAPKPTVTLTADPDIIAPGSLSTLSWNSEHADRCEIEPDIGEVAPSGSREITPEQDTTYTITAFGPGGSATAEVLVQIYPVQVEEIDKSEAHYTSPENTVAAATSALHQQDLDWYYQTFTAETAAQDKQMFEDAGLELTEKFNLVLQSDDYILERVPHEDGLILVLEKKVQDIDGSIFNGWAGFVQEDDLWKVTYKFSEDTELHEYNDVTYTNCIASYTFAPADMLEDSCWHDNGLTNFNATGIALDKRYEEDLSTAVFNGIDTGFAREQLNDMPAEQLSMGGWIKADTIDHAAVIMELGQDGVDSTAIVLEPGNGLRYRVHAAGSLVEGSAAMDYDFHDNQWHHVYLTYDGAEMRLYVDAQLKDAQPVTGSIDAAPVLNIGQRNAAVNNGTANTFKGRLDDLQVYNKALTADEILKKYENGTTQSL